MTGNERGRSEGFLSRWSERKRAVREEESAAEEQAARTAADAAQQDEDAEALAANRAAAEAIDLDSLTPQTDFTPFLKRGVPAALKTAALRKLWRSHPVFACLDGLDVYREDFNSAEFLLKAGKTSWVPGSGYAQRLLELKEKAEEVLAQAEGRTIEGSPADEAGPVAGTAETQVTEEPAEATALADAAETAVENEAGAETAAEEAEPMPRVSLRTRLDFAAFNDKDET